MSQLTYYSNYEGVVITKIGLGVSFLKIMKFGSDEIWK